MLKRITKENINDIKNQKFKNYAKIYQDIYDEFVESIENNGIYFDKREENELECKKIIERIKVKGAEVRNDGASIVINRISTACIACKKGVGSITSYISLMCHRKCYYCFNHNQEEFQYHLHSKRDWKCEINKIIKMRQKLTHIALTGGEPLLHKEDMIEFYKICDENFPNAHKRLYTSGDLLTKDILQNLKKYGLNEIRFSIKLEDNEMMKEKVLGNIALAKEYIDDVMVEMPVIPGTEKELKELLIKLNDLDVYGINLLEFCFPFGNIKAFTSKGFELKYPPYKTLYNFWYAGGLAISQSELLCLKLVEFAIDNNFKLGVHYCSLENKHFGQVYNQNQRIPNKDKTLIFSDKDYYLKCIKIFGEDAEQVRNIFNANNCSEYIINKDYDYIQFNPINVGILGSRDIEMAVSLNIMEEREDGIYSRELKLEYGNVKDFNIDEI